MRIPRNRSELDALRNRLAREVWWLGHACSRIASEFKDIQRVHAGAYTFNVIVYMSPLTRAQCAPFKAALLKEFGNQLTFDDSWMPVAVPRESGCFGMQVIDCASADHAAMVALTMVRAALHELGIHSTMIKVEVEP